MREVKFTLLPLPPGEMNSNYVTRFVQACLEPNLYVSIHIENDEERMLEVSQRALDIWMNDVTWMMKSDSEVKPHIVFGDTALLDDYKRANELLKGFTGLREVCIRKSDGTEYMASKEW